MRAASPLVTVGSLSGGNQQKVLLSRWLEIGPKLLILDEPTRGVDIGAKSEIYRIIDELAARGIGVIVISSELPEIIGICDRVLVMREGHIQGEVGGGTGERSRRKTSDLCRRRRSLNGQVGNGRTRPWQATRLRERVLRVRPRQAVPAYRRGRFRSGASSRRAGMLPVLIIICIAFHYLSDGRFFTAQNVSIVAQQASINTVLAAGMTFVILTGGIDLSVGSILAASAMAGVIASLIPGWGLWGTRQHPHRPVLRVPERRADRIPQAATLHRDTRLAHRRARHRTASWAATRRCSTPSCPSPSSATTPLGVIPWLAVIAFLVVVVSWFILRRTVLGVRIYAVGGNPNAARLSGIKVWAVLLFVYCASGVLAGLGGVMSVARLYAANGLQLGQAYELDAIAAVILGGTSFVGGIGTIWGTLIGALIIAVLTNGLILLGVSDIWQFIIKGLVIIGAVTLDRFRLQGSART